MTIRCPGLRRAGGLAVLLLSFTCLSASAPGVPPGGEILLQCDFGPRTVPVESGFLRIDPATMYSPEQGYGLLSPGLTAYDDHPR